MNKLEFLNKKVKEVDERFEVVKNEGFKDLLFDDRKVCFVDLCNEVAPFATEGKVLVKSAVGKNLTEDEQLILKGVKAFYTAYNQPKEYYVLENDIFKSRREYVNLNLDHLLYFFDSATETPSIQTKFTEEEISEMPDEIQKAIECGFLVKEEVDE